MAHTARKLVLVAALAAAPCLARGAEAQQSGRIQAAAFVIAAPQTVRLQTVDSVAAAPPRAEVQRFRVPGVGALDVSNSAGAAIRVAAVQPREIRVTVDYVAN